MLLTAIAYGPALKAGFMYDDRFFIQENDKIREWKYLPEYFSESGSSIASIKWDGIWRPLRSVSYLADYKIWRLNPFGFHLTSLLWHLLNIVLLYILLGKMFKGQRLRTAACLIFALHPVQTEAVTWISSRGDLMYTAFGLASMIFYRIFKGTGKIWAAALSLLGLVLSLLSKEAAVVVPVLIVLYDWIFEHGGEVGKTLAGWKSYLPYALLTVVYLVVRRMALGRVSQCPYWGDSFWTTAFTMLGAAVEYVRLLFLPLWLKVDYVYELSTSLWDWRVLGALAVLLVISLLAWRDRRKGKFLALGWLWLVAGLLPVSNLLPLTAIMAERFLYLPLAGFAVWAGHLADRISSRRLVYTTLALVAVPMILLTFKRNREWREPQIFWQTEAARSPDSYIAHDYLGSLSYQKGDLAGAEREYLKAVELDSTYVNSLYGLALVYLQQQKYDQAINYAKRNLGLDPSNCNALVVLGNSHGGLGDLASAEKYFRQALEGEARCIEAWNGLGAVYAQRGSWQLAAQAYGQAVRLNPSDLDATMNLALSLERIDPAQAVVQWQRFLKTAGEQGAPVNRAFIEKRITELGKYVP
jgi:tetratricopeptide (TPR) repeat protein